MKIFPSNTIKKLDAYTIEHEPIQSIQLMERAANALTGAITNRWDSETPVTVFAGPGNNGGDALAVARMMAEKGYKVGYVMWPLRTAVSGKQNTPGGATELMEVLGKDESLRRIRLGIEKLQ